MARADPRNSKELTVWNPIFTTAAMGGSLLSEKISPIILFNALDV